MRGANRLRLRLGTRRRKISVVREAVPRGALCVSGPEGYAGNWTRCRLAGKMPEDEHRPNPSRRPETDRSEVAMRSRSNSHWASAILLAMLLSQTACGDAFGPRVGSQYALRSINGRPLPTTLSAGPPADSQFAVYREARYRVVSDSIISYDLRVDLITRHPDGSITSLAANCWDNYPYRYTRLGEALLLAPATRGAVPPPPTPTIHFKDGDLVAELDSPAGIIQLRFELDDQRSEPCSGFMQVAAGSWQVAGGRWQR